MFLIHTHTMDRYGVLMVKDRQGTYYIQAYQTLEDAKEFMRSMYRGHPDKTSCVLHFNQFGFEIMEVPDDCDAMRICKTNNGMSITPLQARNITGSITFVELSEYGLTMPRIKYTFPEIMEDTGELKKYKRED